MVQSHIVALTLIVAILPSNLKLVHIIYILYCRFESEECVAAARTRESSRRFGWDGLDLNPGFIKLTSRWSLVIMMTMMMMMMMTIAKMTTMTLILIMIRLSTWCETLVLLSTLCQSGEFILFPLTYARIFYKSHNWKVFMSVFYRYLNLKNSDLTGRCGVLCSRTPPSNVPGCHNFKNLNFIEIIFHQITHVRLTALNEIICIE